MCRRLVAITAIYFQARRNWGRWEGGGGTGALKLPQILAKLYFS